MHTRTLLLVPYQLIRQPLALVDSQIARRLPGESRPRLMFDSALGSFDQLAGRLLDSTALVQQGVDRVDRADKTKSASLLEREAADLRQAAGDTARQGAEEAEAKAEQAQRLATRGARASRSAEREGKQAATAAARKQAARDKKQAEARAQQRIESAERRREQAEAKASARTAQAAKDAKAKLGNVTQGRTEAAAARRDADRLGDLADAKRRNRTSS